MKKWAVVNRLMTRDEAMKLWPGSEFAFWCQAANYNYPSALVYCTRKKRHTGPHVDYHIPHLKVDIKLDYLIWED